MAKEAESEVAPVPATGPTKEGTGNTGGGPGTAFNPEIPLPAGSPSVCPTTGNSGTTGLIESD